MKQTNIALKPMFKILLLVLYISFVQNKDTFQAEESAESIKEELPFVRNFGYSFSEVTDDFGFDGEWTIDVGGGYKFPFYDYN